jgi:hypothetical protein
MTLTPQALRTLLVFGWFTSCGVYLSAADDPPLPAKPGGTIVDAINNYREARGISANELKNAKAVFANFAKYYADVVSHPLVYKAQQDPSVSTPTSRVPTIDWDINTGVLRDLERFLLTPTLVTPVKPEQADYIREMGIALDAALKPIIQSHPERIVRINATRLLASAAKSGAPAHWPTVTALLNDTFYQTKDKAGKLINLPTPTEIKYYALQAAANLLAAYDVVEYSVRKHSNNPKEVAALIKAVQECVENPHVLVPGIPGKKIEAATADQLAVIAFVRRQAIRALGEVRSASFPSPDGTTLYPAFTLAKICISDPSIVPSPTPADCAEAVIGLCNMAPVYMGNPIKGYNPDAAVEAITAGLLTFAKPRTNPADRSLPWRGYSARIGEALRKWRLLFDPLFNPLNPTVFNDREVPSKVNELIERVQSAILTPIDKVGIDGKPDPTATVDVQRLTEFLKQLRENPKREPELFRGVPSTTLVIPEVK